MRCRTPTWRTASRRRARSTNDQRGNGWRSFPSIQRASVRLVSPSPCVRQEPNATSVCSSFIRSGGQNTPFPGASSPQGCVASRVFGVRVTALHEHVGEHPWHRRFRRRGLSPLPRMLGSLAMKVKEVAVSSIRATARARRRRRGRLRHSSARTRQLFGGDSDGQRRCVTGDDLLLPERDAFPDWCDDGDGDRARFVEQRDRGDIHSVGGRGNPVDRARGELISAVLCPRAGPHLCRAIHRRSPDAQRQLIGTDDECAGRV